MACDAYTKQQHSLGQKKRLECTLYEIKRDEKIKRLDKNKLVTEKSKMNASNSKYDDGDWKIYFKCTQIIKKKETGMGIEIEKIELLIKKKKLLLDYFINPWKKSKAKSCCVIV